MAEPRSRRASASGKQRWTAAQKKDRARRTDRGAGPAERRSPSARADDRRDDRTSGSSERRGAPSRGAERRRDDRAGGWSERRGPSSRTAEDRGGRAYDRRTAPSDARRDDRPRSDSVRREDRAGSGYQRREDRAGSGYRRDDRTGSGYQRRDDRTGSRGDRPQGGYGRRDDRADTYDRRSDDRGGTSRWSRPAADRDADRRKVSKARELTTSRWQLERDARKASWDDETARRDRIGSRGRWSDARDGRGDDRRGRGTPDRHQDDVRDEAPDQMEWTPPEVVADETTVSGFAELGVPDRINAVLAGLGITQPFPIQVATIPDAIAGRDVLGRAQTGSGKTLGFGVPMLARLSARPGRGVRGLVLVPTRELAMQVADVLAPLASSMGMRVTLVAGGMSYGPQRKAFERGVDVVVATPGRLVDLLDQQVASLDSVEVTVLDEADHMADLGFWPAVTRIVDETPAEGQRLLFSATLDGDVDRLVTRYMHDPVRHEVDPGQAAVSTMRHEFWLVAPHHKNDVATRVAGREGRTLVFARTQQGATRIAERLRASGILAGALHGGLTQGARARVLTAFKDGRLPVLVATDVAARGIHVDDVSLVLQVDPPANGKDYLHRAGRTARAGENGLVVSLLLRHQRKQVGHLVQQAGLKADFVPVAPDDDMLTTLVGPLREADPVSEEEYAAITAPPAPVRRPRSGPRPFAGRRPRRTT